MAQQKNKPDKKRKANKKQPNQNKSGGGIPIVNNIVLALAILLLVLWSKDNFRGYQWLTQSLIKNNQKIMEQYGDIPMGQKLSMKLGINGAFVNYVKENTPPDAIILYPPKEVVRDKDYKRKFNHYSTAKYSLRYYLYPRQPVFPDDSGVLPIYDSITHVAIINGWGYHKLNYPVRKKQDLNILPVERPGTKK